MQEHAVIVGGGIAGLSAGILLTKQFSHVTLVEKEPELGGLLRSSYQDGYAFDYGIHYALSTGNDTVNHLLFGDLGPQDWHIFTDSLPEGNYFQGKLHAGSGCIDARSLPEHLFKQGLAELLATRDVENPATLHERFLSLYGETFTREIFTPIVEKFTRHAPDALAPNAYIFGPDRLVVYPSETALAKKKESFFDARIAYEKTEDGSSTITKYYPKEGGIDRWIKNLEQTFIAGGGTVITEEHVEQVAHDNGTINAVTLSRGKTLETAQLFWSVPPVFLGKVANIPVPSMRPHFRHLALVHFVFDCALIEKLHWITLYDSAIRSYRVTLYPNITTEGQTPPPHRITVELFLDNPEELDGMADDALSDLKTTGIIPPDAEPCYTRTQLLPNALPILLPGVQENLAEQCNLLQQQLGNVTFLGGHATGAHGQIAVLQSVYDTLTKQYPELATEWETAK